MQILSLPKTFPLSDQIKPAAVAGFSLLTCHLLSR